MFSIPIVGVIDPGVRKALAHTRGRIGIIGTAATVRSKAYQKAIRTLDPAVKTKAKACPLFVPLAEEGLTTNDATYLIAERYLKPLIEFNIDTLILGCTHYPLLKETIQKVVGRRVSLVDSAFAVAEEVRGIVRSKKERGGIQIYLSDIPPDFTRIGSVFLGERIERVKKVMVEDYV